MVTVSTISNKNTVNLQPKKRHEDIYKNFRGEVLSDNKNGIDHKLSYYKSIKEDEIVEKNTLKKRVQINLEKTLAIPFVHYPRGLGGAPDFTFYESLQTAKLPFYLGGPILASLFYAGVKKDNLKSAAAAKNVAKHMAVGVGLYYVGSWLSKFVVNKTVKLARGVDLNEPYAKAVPSTVNKTGAFKRIVEFHKVPESADFTRTDLMYRKDGKTQQEIDSRYIKLAPRYGVNPNANDVDSTLRPLLKKTIIMSRAWQYALTAFYVALGIGIANQKSWEKDAAGGFKDVVKNGILGKNQTTENRLNAAKIVVVDYMLKPFADGCKQLWKGQNKASSIAGKSIIAASALATLTAITMLVTKTSGKSHDIVLPDKDDKKNTGVNR